MIQGEFLITREQGVRILSGQKCSVIIPTYNRPRYLARTLRYFSTFGTNYPIVIADSGAETTQITNKETVASRSSLDVTYRTYTESPEIFGGFESKISDALNYCDSKYCVVSGDDDLVAPAAINASVDFLEQNPDFAFAHGDYLNFWVNPKSRSSLSWSPVYKGRSLTYSDPALRLEYHISHYATDTTFYAVQRTALLKHILREILESGLRLVVFRELYSTGIGVIHGKTRYLNIFYCAKDRSSERVQSVPDIAHLRAGPAYREEENHFKDALTSYLSEHSTLSAKASKATVEAALSGYLERQLPTKQRYLERTVISVRENLYSRGLGEVYDCFRGMYRGTYRTAFPRDIYSTRRAQCWIMLKGRLVWINYEDFKNISKFVLSNTFNIRQP